MSSPKLSPKLKQLPRFRVRQMKPFERLPDDLPPFGLEGLNAIDPEWVWVAEMYGRVIAAGLAAPVHGALVLLRIIATDDAPVWWAVILLRKMLKDAQKRGLKAYITALDLNHAAERKLAIIAKNAGAHLEPIAVTLAMGPTRIKW